LASIEYNKVCALSSNSRPGDQRPSEHQAGEWQWNKMGCSIVIAYASYKRIVGFHGLPLSVYLYGVFHQVRS